MPPFVLYGILWVKLRLNTPPPQLTERFLLDITQVACVDRGGSLRHMNSDTNFSSERLKRVLVLIGFAEKNNNVP